MSRFNKEGILRPFKRLLQITVGISVVSILSSCVAFAQHSKTHIPPRAFEYRDILYEEVDFFIPHLPDYNFVPSIIEHESCISLTHSRCWSPTAELKTSREQGVGFFQITRTWNSDQTVRFDTLANLKKSYTSHLREISWDNIKARADLQFRAGVLLMMENLNKVGMIKDPYERMAFLAAMHNGGGWPLKERNACKMTTGCDPDKWFDNVENACMRSKKPMSAYGNRSICDIAKGYVRDIFSVRFPKYQDQYYTLKYIESKKVVIEEEVIQETVDEIIEELTSEGADVTDVKVEVSVEEVTIDNDESNSVDPVIVVDVTVGDKEVIVEEEPISGIVTPKEPLKTDILKSHLIILPASLYVIDKLIERIG